MATVNHNALARAKERMATFKSRRKDMGASLDEVGYINVAQSGATALPI
jgi:hypothetical protein